MRLAIAKTILRSALSCKVFQQLSLQIVVGIYKKHAFKFKMSRSRPSAGCLHLSHCRHYGVSHSSKQHSRQQ